MIRAYHRPATLDEALALLETDGAAALGGGTTLVASGEASAVVDLQDLGFDDIGLNDERISVGALVRLRDFIESDLVPQTLRDLAKREAPSTIRNAATIGGTVAAGDPESELLAGLLAFEGRVTVAGADGTGDHTLDDYLEARPRGVITSVALAGGVAATARTGRTPADRPIVAAVARRDGNGAIRLALTGVAATPVLVDPADVADLDPPADFRGSTEYRRHLAETLSARAITALEA